MRCSGPGRPRLLPLLPSLAAWLLATAATRAEGRREVETDAALQQEEPEVMAASETQKGRESFQQERESTLARGNTSSHLQLVNDSGLATAQGEAGLHSSGLEAVDHKFYPGLQQAHGGRSNDSLVATEGHLVAEDATVTAHSPSRSAGGASMSLLSVVSAALRRGARVFSGSPQTTCQEDDHGEHLGCRIGQCPCRWFEHCYPKRWEGHEVGVCSPGVSVLVGLSLLIIGNVVAIVVVLRLFFQWRDRIRTLMAKSPRRRWGEDEVDAKDNGAPSGSQASGEKQEKPETADCGGDKAAGSGANVAG
mmetsp:Transcript_106239/g.317421  ORF Transcript_106239/g.317421 Transcript_106239/m.317421 type:complete len:307 (-) Transcript_106239:134-1054(-)